jgi:hypothetical protein
MTTTADEGLDTKTAAATSSETVQVRLIAASVKGWPSGESHGRVVYRDQVVADARRLRALGIGVTDIGRTLGVRTATVADWLSGRRRVPAVRVLAKAGPPKVRRGIPTATNTDSESAGRQANTVLSEAFKQM